MNYLKKFIIFNHCYFLNLYRKILEKQDKQIFANLFNFKSFLMNSPLSLKWENSHFNCIDKTIPNFKMKIRHVKQCNRCYEKGFRHRADKLADLYFFKEINFKDDDILLDCGANVGDIKIWFNLNSIKINYIGFEPGKTEFELLKQNVYPSVVYNYGLYNENCNLKFYLRPDNAGSTIIKPKENNIQTTIQVKKIEEFIDSRIKCIKIEVEGAEPEVVEGLGEKINNVEFITADLGFGRGENSESELIPVTNFLLKRNFELINFKVAGTRITALYKNKNINQHLKS